MKLLTAMLGLAAAMVHVAAQSSTSLPVPTGTPVPGNYTGPYRPQVHFSPPQHFMNDPNGCFRDDNGTWHLYYQCTPPTNSPAISPLTHPKDNPTGNVAGNQHWGHATSPDLYHWTNQPIALFALNSSSYVFSGSIVVDRNNTSGFFPAQSNGVVAIFTIATYAPVALESQGLAISHDGGYSFSMYAGNPVLDIGSDQFRDPKVFWYDDHWVMAVAYAQDFVIGLFTSPDLKTWTHASNFTHHGLLGLQYECPNLVRVPLEGDSPGATIWLLQISINPGSPLGGSSSQYFLGAFDGYVFTPTDNATRLSDFGKDAYAGQFFDNLPEGQAVSINWASNWQYAQDAPTGRTENWRSAMALPHAISVRRDERVGLVEVARPYDLAPVLGSSLARESLTNGSLALDFAPVASNAVLVNITAMNLPPRANITAGTLNMTLLSPISGEYLRAGYYLSGDNPVWVDRGGARGFDNVFFTDKFSANALAPLDGGSWSMTAVYDRSLFELFAADGALSATASVFPASPLSLLTVGADAIPAGASVRVEVTELRSVWTAQEDAGGTVRGNVTTGANGNGTLAEGRHRRMIYEAAFE